MDWDKNIFVLYLDALLWLLMTNYNSRNNAKL